jgi:hypothetical protein
MQFLFIIAKIVSNAELLIFQRNGTPGFTIVTAAADGGLLDVHDNVRWSSTPAMRGYG